MNSARCTLALLALALAVLWPSGASAQGQAQAAATEHGGAWQSAHYCRSCWWRVRWGIPHSVRAFCQSACGRCPAYVRRCHPPPPRCTQPPAARVPHGVWPRSCRNTRLGGACTATCLGFYEGAPTATCQLRYGRAVWSRVSGACALDTEFGSTGAPRADFWKGINFAPVPPDWDGAPLSCGLYGSGDLRDCFGYDFCNNRLTGHVNDALAALAATGLTSAATHARWYSAKHKVHFFGCDAGHGNGCSARDLGEVTLSHQQCVADVAAKLTANPDARKILYPVSNEALTTHGEPTFYYQDIVDEAVRDFLPSIRAWQLSNEATESGQGEETNIFKKILDGAAYIDSKDPFDLANPRYIIVTFAGNNQNSPKQDRSDWMFQTSAQFVAYVSTNRPSLKSRIAIGLNIYDDTRQVGNCNAIDRWVTQWFGEVPAGCPDIRNPSNPSSWVGMKWPNGGGFVPLVITEYGWPTTDNKYTRDPGQQYAALKYQTSRWAELSNTYSPAAGKPFLGAFVYVSADSSDGTNINWGLSRMTGATPTYRLCDDPACGKQPNLLSKYTYAAKTVPGSSVNVAQGVVDAWNGR